MGGEQFVQHRVQAGNVPDLGHTDAIGSVGQLPVALRRDVEVLAVPGHLEPRDEAGEHIRQATAHCRIPQVG